MDRSAGPRHQGDGGRAPTPCLQQRQTSRLRVRTHAIHQHCDTVSRNETCTVTPAYRELIGTMKICLL